MEITLEPKVDAPVNKGQSLGTMTVRSGDSVLAQIPLVAAETVERKTLTDLFVTVLRKIAMAK